MKQFFFLYATLFLLLSCANQLTTNEPITISVDLSQAVTLSSSTDFSVREINLDEKEGVDPSYSLLCSLIPTESSLIFFTDTKAYVLDSDGNLIKKIGDRGNAGNEYIKIWSLFLKNNGHIIINDSNKLLEYTENGEFVKKYDIPTSAGQELSLVGANFYAVKVGLDKSSLLVLNSDFEVITEVDSLKLPMMLNGCTTFNQKDFLFFYFPQKINVLTSDFKVQEKYTIDFGKDNPIIAPKGEMLSDAELMENFTKRANMGGAMRNTENVFYFDVMCSNSLYIVKYDKQSKQTTAYKVFQADTSFISNNNRFHDNRYSYIRGSENGLMVGLVTLYN